MRYNNRATWTSRSARDFSGTYSIYSNELHTHLFRYRKTKGTLSPQGILPEESLRIFVCDSVETKQILIQELIR